jgi:hypothetical protein
MTIPNPEYLLEQAAKLARAPIAGAPRQTDLRRAISAAYYAVFNFTLTCLADEFVGVQQRPGRRYALGRFKQASQDDRRLFLTILLCPPR